MSRSRYGPSVARELWELKYEIDRLFTESITRAFNVESLAHDAWAPSVDVYENDTQVVLLVELPGVRREDVEITIDGDVLTIRGVVLRARNEGTSYHLKERNSGPFLRSFQLPTHTSHDCVTASLKDGLLHIYLPKQKRREGTRIEVDSNIMVPQRGTGVDISSWQLQHEDYGFIEEFMHHPEPYGESDKLTLEPYQEVGQDAPQRLFVNLWIDDAEGEPCVEPVRLSVGNRYFFHIAIEPWARPGRNSPFTEPDSLKGNEKTTLLIEVFCPIIDAPRQSICERRRVDYYAGFGFPPETFALVPAAVGQYYLTVRVVSDRETIYREVYTIEVVDASATDSGDSAKDSAELPATV